MKCKECDNALTGRQREFCSDKCRKRTSRTESGPQDGSQATNADRMAVERGQIEVGQRTRTVAIPGDADYSGCCKLVDGDWQVDSTKPDVKSMDNDELIRRLHYIKQDWQQSPEHKEVMRRRETAGVTV